MADALPLHFSKRCTSHPRSRATREVPSVLPSSTTRMRSAGRNLRSSAMVPGSSSAPLRHAMTAVTSEGSLVNRRSSLRPSSSTRSFTKSTSAQSRTTKTML